MSATFFNMRRRLAAQKAEAVKAAQKPEDKPSEKPKRGKVKKDG